MHETRFAGEIIFYLKNELVKHREAKSVIVGVSLRPFSHVTPEGLKGTFELLAETEKLKNVTLEIKLLSLKVNCKDCGHTFESSKLTFLCIKCLGTNIDIKKEREFSVDSIEIENRE